jgi:hypothetical protein
MEQLFGYIEQHQDAPYKWGDFDCCQFAGRWVELASGKDILSGYEYSTKKEAMAILSENGGLASLISKHLGEPIPPVQAKRGDVVLRDNAAGICAGRLSYFASEEGGLSQHLTLECDKAWRV